MLYTLTVPASWAPGGNITAGWCLLSLCLSAGEYQVTISDNEEMRRLREAVTRTWSWTRIARKRKLAGFGASCAGTALLLNCKLIGNNVVLLLYKTPYLGFTISFVRDIVLPVFYHLLLRICTSVALA